MGEEQIRCPQCGRHITPHLSHVSKTLSHPLIRHICPFCGAVINESGGGPRWGCIIAVILAIVIPILLISLPAILVTLNVLLRRYTY